MKDEHFLRKTREAARIKISPPECLECEYELCADYCTSPDTPILMADFTTKPISDVEIWDKIIAFDENPDEEGEKRRYRIATVEKTFSHIIDEVLYYINNSPHGFTKGHPFLTKYKNDTFFAPIGTIDSRYDRVFRNRLLSSDYIHDTLDINFDELFTIGFSDICKITKKHHKGIVCNLKTSTRTYIADNILVHNCMGGCCSEFGCLKKTAHIVRY